MRVLFFVFICSSVFMSCSSPESETRVSGKRPFISQFEDCKIFIDTLHQEFTIQREIDFVEHGKMIYHLETYRMTEDKNVLVIDSANLITRKSETYFY